MAEPFFESKKYEQPKTVFDQLTASNDPKIALLGSQRLETLKAFDGAHESGAPKQGLRLTISSSSDLGIL